MKLYVYYTVPEADLPGVMQAARAMQARLMALHPGLACELLRRPEVRPAGVTVMETYRAPGLSDGFVDALQSAAAGLPQPRHVERFMPLA